jgi:hypothetical protein
MPFRRKASGFGRGAGLGVLLVLAVAVGGLRMMVIARSLRHESGLWTAASGDTAHMSRTALHMKMTESRPIEPGDQKKADAILSAAKTAMAPYQDYRKALADGYQIFLPRVPQPEYHFTNRANAIAALTNFDPIKPTSLLYEKTPDGGYKLVGAMYTDRVDATEGELNARIPLSVARWHEHVNFCKAPPGHLAGYFGPNAKFGMLGSINTREACDAAGGTFIPHVFGWMVHVYPYETDPKKIWSMHAGQNNEGMNGNEMQGMKMD